MSGTPSVTAGAAVPSSEGGSSSAPLDPALNGAGCSPRYSAWLKQLEMGELELGEPIAVIGGDG